MSVSAVPSATTSSRPSRSAARHPQQLLTAQPAQHPDARRAGRGRGRPPAATRSASAAAVRGSSWASSASSRSASGVRVSSDGDVLAGAQQLGEPLGHLALVAQQPQVPLVAAERLADLPVGQQPGVGVGAGREGLQQHRQQVLLHRRRAGDPAGERAQVAQRRLGVGEAERAQPVPRRLRPQLQLLAGHAGDRRQQRPVEELLVQPAHLAGVQRQLGLQHVDGAAPGVGLVAQRAGQPAQLLVVGGQQVGAPQPQQLQPVLDGAQEPVGGDQRGGVLAPDVAAGRQRLQRRQRAADPQRGVDPAVHHLQQLDGELDVAQARRGRA